MAFRYTGYDPEELDRSMAAIPAGPARIGLTAAEKQELTTRAGVHIDMLHFHPEARAVDTPAFWIDRYPVTRGQFLRFLKATGYRITYNGWLVGWSELANWRDFSSDSPSRGRSTSPVARWPG